MTESGDSRELQPDQPRESAKKPSGMLTRRNRLIKAVLALIMIAGLLWFTIPSVQDYVGRKPPEDTAKRPLIIIAIPPNAGITRVDTTWYLNKENKEDPAKLDIAISGGSATSRSAPIDGKKQIEIVLISQPDAPDALKCSRQKTTPAKILRLDPGVVFAAKVDATSTGLYAGGALTLVDLSTNDANVYYYGGDVQDAVCSLSEDMIWKTGPTSTPAWPSWMPRPRLFSWMRLSPPTTVLIPEIEVVQSDRGSISKLEHNSAVQLQRPSGQRISDSEPAMTPIGSEQFRADIFFFLRKDLAGELLYSVKPYVVLDDESVERNGNIILAAAGIVFGFVGALGIYVLESLYDLVLGRLIGGPDE